MKSLPILIGVARIDFSFIFIDSLLYPGFILCCLFGGCLDRVQGTIHIPQFEYFLEKVSIPPFITHMMESP